MQSLSFRRITIVVIFTLLANVFILSTFTEQVQAANLSQASMILYRMGVSRATSTTDPILIIAKPATGVATNSQVKVSFAPNFSFGASTNVITVTTAAVPGTIALPMTVEGQVVSAWPLVSGSATTLSGTDVSFTGAALVAGSLYGFFITAGVTNPGTTAGNPYVSTIATYNGTGSTLQDSSRVAVATTTASGDQVTVTASVPPTFSFSLGSNAIALGDLSSTSTKNGNVVATISTNASNGYVTWVRGSGGSNALSSALASATVNATILSNGTPGGGSCSAYSSGNDYYQLSSTFTHSAGNGTITKNANYDCGLSFTSGGTIGKYYQEVMRSSGTASGDTVTLYAMAAMAALDKAATDYTDTWTVVGAGNF